MPYLLKKNDGSKMIQILVHYDKMNGFSRKNQNFIEGILLQMFEFTQLKFHNGSTVLPSNDLIYFF